MAETYALLVQIESHEYYGEFYLLGEGYSTQAEVLDHVASDHLVRLSDDAHIESYLLDVLSEGQIVSKDEYEATDADIECWLHVDVPYQRYTFGSNNTMTEFTRKPTEGEIASKVEDLRS